MRDSSSAGSLKICRVHRNVIVLEIDLDVVAYAMKILVNVKGAGRELEPDRVLVLDAGLVISHVHVLNVKKKRTKSATFVRYDFITIRNNGAKYERSEGWYVSHCYFTFGF